MTRVQKIYDITLQLEKLLNQDISPQNRDQLIVRVNQLIAARGKHMETLPVSYTEREKTLGRNIILRNNRIEQKMKVLFAALKNEMKLIKKRKQTNRNYINPYEHIETIDGMFLDSKK
jgi:flagellar protein FliT